MVKTKIWGLEVGVMLDYSTWVPHLTRCHLLQTHTGYYTGWQPKCAQFKNCLIYSLSSAADILLCRYTYIMLSFVMLSCGHFAANILVCFCQNMGKSLDIYVWQVSCSLSDAAAHITWHTLPGQTNKLGRARAGVFWQVWHEELDVIYFELYQFWLPKFLRLVLSQARQTDLCI